MSGATNPGVSGRDTYEKIPPTKAQQNSEDKRKKDIQSTMSRIANDEESSDDEPPKQNAKIIATEPCEGYGCSVSGGKSRKRIRKGKRKRRRNTRKRKR